jgi:methyl-accepting chemotaxis protein
MTSISNMKIGRKIAVVLGGTVFLLAGLSILSLWGLRTTERLAEDTVQRLAKAQLAETIAGDTSAIGQGLGKMILAKKVTEEMVNEIGAFGKTRTDNVAAFRALANTPKSTQHGVDMDALVQAGTASGDRLLAQLRAGRYAEALAEYRNASTITTDLRAKAKEASQWQEQLVEENEAKRNQTSNTIWITLVAGSLLAVAAAVFGGIVLRRGIAAPLARTVIHLKEIAQGDLSKNAPPEFLARRDEIGSLARAEQVMIEALRKIMQEISGGVETLSGASSDLTASAQRMSLGAEKAQTVAAATEEMSANVTSVATGMEQTTTNLSNVAAATDEMTGTIGEIAGNSEKARRITGDATRQASRITDQINQLGVAAREIGKVTETITEISSQTNLLALNATIEAARAGSAGKGFAVVANEIKALAQQTAAATQDIKTRVASVQDATAAGIAEIGKVSKVIDEVSEIVASIAAAIEEQAAATKGIAQNIAEASAGVADASKRVAETSHITREVARDILDMERSVTGGTDNVRTNSSGLSAVAEQLKQTVSRFRV